MQDQDETDEHDLSYVPEWRCCFKDPPPEGIKVLCEREGDFYCCQRFREYYIPVPFSTHCFAILLCKPTQWLSIPFPPPYTGKVRVALHPLHEPIDFDKLKEIDEKLYNNFCDAIIGSIGDEKMDQELRNKRK